MKYTSQKYVISIAKHFSNRNGFVRRNVWVEFSEGRMSQVKWGGRFV